LAKKKLTPLWSLHGDSSHISYLFGTMHVQDARAFAFVDKAKGCIEQCDEFFSEIRLDELMNERMLMAQRMPEGQSLKSLLGEKKFAKAEKVIAKSFNTSLSQLDGLLPMVVVNVLMVNTLSIDQAQHLDMTMYQYAHSLGKRLRGLATIEEHVSVLENIPLDMQRKQFLDLVRSPKKYKQKVAQMADEYAKGDIYNLYKSSKKSLGKLKRVMLYDRNISMADRIFENIETPSFYAFGAGHLAGKEGIIRLLKNKGLKVKPILV